MNESPTFSTQSFSLIINGSELATGQLPQLLELEPALRSIALSDSPVIIRSPDSVQEHILDRLHCLSRRATLPVRKCNSINDADQLLDALSPRGDTHPSTLGTWAIFNIDQWPKDAQNRLSELLEALDLGRLHGRLRHERIPRVMAFCAIPSTTNLTSALERRLSYFTLTAKPTEKGI
ncbi:MAG: hypothetical protein KTR25_07570 [Myxococcales bacterium]|nr:hypothetical protein [Myxococcales bacterium]